MLSRCLAIECFTCLSPAVLFVLARKRLQKEHAELTKAYVKLEEEANREARLRTAVAGMALVGYSALYEGVAEASGLRSICPPVPQDHGFGAAAVAASREPPAPLLAPPPAPPPLPQSDEVDGMTARPSTREGLTEGVASRSATLDEAMPSAQPSSDVHGGNGLLLVEGATVASLQGHADILDASLTAAVLHMDEIAPFNSPPPPHAPLTTIEQLCMLANQLPPPHPLPPLPLPASSVLPSPEAMLAPLSKYLPYGGARSKTMPQKEQRPRQSASQPRLPSRAALGAPASAETSSRPGSGGLELPAAYSVSSLHPRAKGSISSVQAPQPGFVVSGVVQGGTQGAVLYGHLEPHKLSPTKKGPGGRQSKDESAAENVESSRVIPLRPQGGAPPANSALGAQLPDVHRPQSMPSMNHPVKIQELLQAPYVRPTLRGAAAEPPQSVPARWGSHHTGRWGDPPPTSGARARSNASPMRPRSKQFPSSPLPKGHPLGFVAGQAPPAVARGPSPPPMSAVRLPS